jgi:hypothetical protein
VLKENYKSQKQPETAEKSREVGLVKINASKKHYWVFVMYRLVNNFPPLLGGMAQRMPAVRFVGGAT